MLLHKKPILIHKKLLHNTTVPSMNIESYYMAVNKSNIVNKGYGSLCSGRFPVIRSIELVLILYINFDKESAKIVDFST